LFLIAAVKSQSSHVREIGRLQNLQTLDVSSTNIRRLPVEIGKLKHLETLDVSRTEVMDGATYGNWETAASEDSGHK
jgi:Leucine-rich repeat (LRR) protein